ncbi:UNVERIFIED_CONTAM: hypothetical protein GTU68_038229 [Idotea baltica]|nr:hypothetical protein [Idotea baltica]
MGSSEVKVLQNLNLSVQAKEKVAIIGPSGSGKTTLLLILTGLETPSSGEIVISGESFVGKDGDARADLRKEHIARENVALPLEIAGTPNGRQLAMEMLDKVGLSDRHDHYPAQLSGGEQQRVAIARALVHGPKLIVADEPTGNLDEDTSEQIMQLLFELNRDSGTTLLLVTHDNELAKRCDRTLRLHDGSLKPINLETTNPQTNKSEVQ